MLPTSISKVPAAPALRLCGTLLLSLTALGPAGCRAPSPQTDKSLQPDSRPLVLASFTVLADMGRAVACGRLRVDSITRPGAEVHGYEMTPGDLRRASGTRLLLENGLGLDRWTRRFTDRLGAVPRVTASEGVSTLAIGAGVANPHAWMAPRAALVYVENLRRAFSRLDPAGAATFRYCADAYAAELRSLDGDLRQRLAALPAEKRLLVTCEGAFSYLARDYGLQEAWLWPVNGEREVTPRRMGHLIETVRRRRVPAVFCESTVDARIQRRVAAESGARFGGNFHVDSLSPPGGGAATYLELMRHNADLLVNGLAPRRAAGPAP